MKGYQYHHNPTADKQYFTDSLSAKETSKPAYWLYCAAYIACENNKLSLKECSVIEIVKKIETVSIIIKLAVMEPLK